MDDWKTQLIEMLEKEKSTLEEAKARAKFARDNAPSANESHSDTTRSEQEKLVFALEEELKKLKNELKILEKGEGDWKYCEIDNGGVRMKIVLGSMGGKKIGDIVLLSKLSPLGKELTGKKGGDWFEFMERKVEVLTVQ